MAVRCQQGLEGLVGEERRGGRGAHRAGHVSDAGSAVAGVGCRLPVSGGGKSEGRVVLSRAGAAGVLPARMWGNQWDTWGNPNYTLDAGHTSHRH